MNHLTPLAKRLRINSTDTENCLWKYLRAKRFEGLKFKRQQPVGPFIVDFICFEKKLVIECDGGQHDWLSEEDQRRDKFLKDEGFKVLRFWNNEVLANIKGVLQVIFEACREGTCRQPPLPNPLPRGERE